MITFAYSDLNIIEMYKFIILTIVFSLNSYLLHSQEGPGGVGSSSNNILWLDASAQSFADGDAVDTWVDISGNSNDGIQLLGSTQPTFNLNLAALNDRSTVSFDGVDDFMNLTSHITASATSSFTVYKSNTSSYVGLYSINKHQAIGRNVSSHVAYDASLFRVNKNNRNFTIFSQHTGSGALSGTVTASSDNNTGTFARGEFRNAPDSKIGCRVSDAGVLSNLLDGDIAEIIIYNEELNTASQNIILSSLSAKYDLTVPNSLYNFSTHTFNVKGIGQESDGDNLVARGLDSLSISNPSSLDDGDYILVGHDNGGYSTSASVPPGFTERLAQIWRAEITGTPGSIDIEIFLNGGVDFSSFADYALIIENNDGDFSNGDVTTITTGKSYIGGTNSILFSGVTLSDGDYFTLGEIPSAISSIADGDWDNTSTWNCGCVPGITDEVTINTTHDVDIDAVASVFDLTISSGGSLNFLTSDSLYISGDLIIDGSLDAGDGTISFTNEINPQSISNTSGSQVIFSSIHSGCTAGLSLLNGGWAIDSSLQVTDGTFDVSLADSIVLVSTPTYTSEIKESAASSIVGDFIIQRYVGARSANYGDFSAPTQTATAADLDDDLFISGIGGVNGNATTSGGGIFYSILSYDRQTDAHAELTSTTSSLTSGRGYEVYLATTASNFAGATIDFIGVPYTGSTVKTDVNRFWNLIGNPYHSFIDWDLVDKTAFVNNNYYVFNTDNGSYEFFSGGSMPPIAPEQGFWVYQPNSGGYKISFKESDKVSSNDHTFYRKANKQDIELTIGSNLNQFKQKLKISLNTNSTSNFEETDAPYLRSPIKNAPGIFSTSENNTIDLTKNSINPSENSHIIPVSIETGVSGKYTIEAKNLEVIYEHYSCIYIKDEVTNQQIDLQFDQSFDFETKEGKSDRFKLILSNSFDDCEKLLSGNTNNEPLSEGFSLRNNNGILYLDYSLEDENTQVEINVFNLNGQRVIKPIQTTVNEGGSFPINNLSELNGIYIIRAVSNKYSLNETIKL